VKKRPVLLDSSVWIEILNSGPKHLKCQKEFDHAERIIVPMTVIFEVYRKLASLLSEDQALSGITILLKHEIKDLTQEVALTAADLSLQHKLAMADSLILSHAKMTEALFVTMDNDFSGLEDVIVIR